MNRSGSSRLLVTVGLGWFAALLLLPLATVFIQALEPGLAFFWHAISEPDALSARVTALVTLCSVPLEPAVRRLAAWAIARFRFPGRQPLITLSICRRSPAGHRGLDVRAAVRQSRLVRRVAQRARHQDHFATPLGIILATTFITVPFVVRELLPQMEARGPEEEGRAAIMLGRGVGDVLAGDPARHPLESDVWPVALYRPGGGGIWRCSVVSGHIRGQTNTLPLHIEILYNEYQTGAAFAVASLLALFGIFTLLGETLLAGLRGQPTQSH